MHSELIKTILSIEAYKASSHTASIINDMSEGKPIDPEKIAHLKSKYNTFIQISEQLGIPITPAECYVLALRLSDIHKKYPELEEKLYCELYQGS